MSGETSTLDGFLGGRLRIAQPKRGFRAGHDTVLLAAAVPAEAGSRVLELGAGAGVASLCLAARVEGASVLGIEIDPDLVALANENAARNGMGTRVRFEAADAAAMSGGPAFDHVFFNPPFHSPTGQESPNPARDRAMRDSTNAVSEWTRIALALTKPGGTVTAIAGAGRASDLLAAREGAVLFPLFPHRGDVPKRAIVQIVKGSTAPFRAATGLILHEADGRNTEGTEAVLREGRALRLV
ncbi:MAG TPA: methyltransferase [Micropepsaceae bacterium]|nr:methyltransferase [Micropepsaceae bacterium]